MLNLVLVFGFLATVELRTLNKDKSFPELRAYSQCGGIDWTLSTTCPSGFYCSYQNPWSQIYDDIMISIKIKNIDFLIYIYILKKGIRNVCQENNLVRVRLVARQAQQDNRTLVRLVQNLPRAVSKLAFRTTEEMK